MRIGLDDGKICAFDGKSENKQDWTFLYPDSVYERMKYKFLFVKDPDSLLHRLSFRVISNKDTLRFGEISFKKSKSVINLQYMKTIIVEKSWQQIPILKDIYKDQLGKIDMVYISIDEPETVDKLYKILK